MHVCINHFHMQLLMQAYSQYGAQLDIGHTHIHLHKA